MEQPLTLLRDISFGIVFATLAAHGARLLRQPPILGYVLGGVLLGANLGFGLVTSAESIETISEIGLIFLLFIIGLEINLRELARMGKSMFVLGVVQFVACVLIGAGLFALLGYRNAGGHFDLLYLAVALALSSTLIVVKLLHDKFETSSVAGRLTIGVLVLQDIWAIVFMAVQPSLHDPQVGSILRSLDLGLVLLAVAFVASRYLLPGLFRAAAKNPELVLLTAIGWCFSVCSLAAWAGLSKEMGALIAGVSIAAYPYGTDVISKIAGVRDFFVTLFFVALGLQMPKPTGPLLAVAAFAVSAVVITRLLSVIPTVALLGRGLRTGAVTAINLAQISEFSLVIVALGVVYGHVTAEVQMTVLTAMLMSSLCATYLITFNDRLARGLLALLSLVGVRGREEEFDTMSGRPLQAARRDIVLLGCYREGMGLLDRISRHAPELAARVLVVDYNPDVQARVEPLGYEWVYGDLANPDALRHQHIEEATVIVCSVGDTFLKGTSNLRLLEQLQGLAPDAYCIMTAEDHAVADRLRAAGACHVFIPSDVAGEHLLAVVREHVTWGRRRACTAPWEGRGTGTLEN